MLFFLDESKLLAILVVTKHHVNKHAWHGRVVKLVIKSNDPYSCSTLIDVALTVEAILQIMLRSQRATVYYEFSYFLTFASTAHPIDEHG